MTPRVSLLGGAALFRELNASHNSIPQALQTVWPATDASRDPRRRKGPFEIDLSVRRVLSRSTRLRIKVFFDIDLTENKCPFEIDI